MPWAESLHPELTYAMGRIRAPRGLSAGLHVAAMPSVAVGDCSPGEACAAHAWCRLLPLESTVVRKSILCRRAAVLVCAQLGAAYPRMDAICYWHPVSLHISSQFLLTMQGAKAIGRQI